MEYWDDPIKRPENLSRSEFDEFILRNPVLDMEWDDRTSGDGEHGLDGEDNVYKGSATVRGFGGVEKKMYLKFYFWKKGDPRAEQGITVQSFKPYVPQN